MSTDHKEKRTKQIITSSLLLALLLISVSAPASAQDQRAYSRVLCVKATPGRTAERIDLATNFGQKIAQARVDAGGPAVWYFMQAVIPAGERAPCDFLVVHGYDGFPTPLLPLGEALAKAGVNMKAAEFRAKRAESSRLVDAELSYLVERVGTVETGNYIRVNYMKVHDMQEWLDLESNVWKQIMEERVKAGRLKAWRAFRLFLPRGTSLPYNAVTVDVFPDWASIGKPGEINKFFEKAHPGRRFRDIGPRVQAARDIVNSHLYRVVAKASASGR